MVNDKALENLIEVLAEKYGYDYSNYARASLKRRVNRLMSIERFEGLDVLLERLKTDSGFLTHLVQSLTVNVTEMFRDPALFRTLRDEVLPVLATHPFIRIWHAGCATGEEVYSMAILLEEQGLLDKSLLYATDISPGAIEKFKSGIFPLSQMKQYSENYIRSGGRQDFSKYYTAQYDRAKFNERFKSKMIIATHNLVSDRSFNAFQLIICRNVLIYFDKVLQDRVLALFNESLDKLGYLVLGSKENIRFSGVAVNFQPLNATEKIWRKTK
jgi:chemotaxis protein methyltransferase CheR